MIGAGAERTEGQYHESANTGPECSIVLVKVFTVYMERTIWVSVMWRVERARCLQGTFLVQATGHGQGPVER